MRQDASTIFTLPLERVLEDRNFNIRIFFGDIDQLAIQLMTEGQHEPIKVRQESDQYFVVDGHRRQSAFARSRQFRIEESEGKYLVFEGNRPLREAPGPVHPEFDSSQIRCRLAQPNASEEELFASQLIYNSGKPFTLLERMIFVSRLNRHGSYTREQLALKTGFSRTHIANAQNLNAADPRLIEYVREGRISQKLALRLLKSLSAEQQMAQVCAAMAEAERHHRDKLLPKDFDWGVATNGQRPKAAKPESIDPVRARLHDLVTRLGDGIRFAPNPTAVDRLETLMRINRFATGKLSYPKVEAHLLGRE
jgi:hypothetical protein